jgi:hypothetical protein
MMGQSCRLQSKEVDMTEVVPFKIPCRARADRAEFVPLNQGMGWLDEELITLFLNVPDPDEFERDPGPWSRKNQAWLSAAAGFNRRSPKAICTALNKVLNETDAYAALGSEKRPPWSAGTTTCTSGTGRGA